MKKGNEAVDMAKKKQFGRRISSDSIKVKKETVGAPKRVLSCHNVLYV